ncbi:MAG: hypothetical protein CMJ46_00520 [Planctomyces sp.]|nr:hypothetical protein [Planctomyces sp.]
MSDMNFWRMRGWDAIFLEENEKCSDWLVQDLSRFLNTEVDPYDREFIESKGSRTRVRGVIMQCETLNLRFDGELLFKIRKQKFPYIYAHITLYSGNERLGLRDLQGESYLAFRYFEEENALISDSNKIERWRRVGWLEEPQFDREIVP